MVKGLTPKSKLNEPINTRSRSASKVLAWSAEPAPLRLDPVLPMPLTALLGRAAASGMRSCTSIVIGEARGMPLFACAAKGHCALHSQLSSIDEDRHPSGSYGVVALGGSNPRSQLRGRLSTFFASDVSEREIRDERDDDHEEDGADRCSRKGKPAILVGLCQEIPD